MASWVPARTVARERRRRDCPVAISLSCLKCKSFLSFGEVEAEKEVWFTMVGGWWVGSVL